MPVSFLFSVLDFCIRTLFQLFRACLRCAHVEYHARFLLPLSWWWFAGRCVFTHCSVWSLVPVSSLEMAGGGHGEAKPDVSVLDMVLSCPILEVPHWLLVHCSVSKMGLPGAGLSCSMVYVHF